MKQLYSIHIDRVPPFTELYYHDCTYPKKVNNTIQFSCVVNKKKTNVSLISDTIVLMRVTEK